jgi:hypothetical protein
MTVKQLKEIAKAKGVRVGNMRKKATLIKAIQKAEGSFDCFGTAMQGSCDQMYCLWRDDCLK